MLFAPSVVVPGDLARPERLEEEEMRVNVEDQRQHDVPAEQEAPEDVRAEPDPGGEDEATVHSAATDDPDDAEEGPDAVLDGQQNEGVEAPGVLDAHLKRLLVQAQIEEDAVDHPRDVQTVHGEARAAHVAAVSEIQLRPAPVLVVVLAVVLAATSFRCAVVARDHVQDGGLHGKQYPGFR